MKTKIIYKYIVGLLLGGFFMLSSCTRDFLDQLPLDNISEFQYWNTPADAELYANSFYLAYESSGIFGNGLWGVAESDDFERVQYSNLFAGTRLIPSSGGGWDFSNIRKVNYFLENYQKIEGSFDEYKQYVGEAYYFRAYHYFKFVQTFGDFPIYEKTLNMDSEELFAPRNPRQEVIDFVIKDLDKAIEYMNSGSVEGGTRVNKEVAQLFKSKVCLYEGTWEKYHNGTVFGVSNPKTKEYLTMAASSAMEVINSDYHLYKTGDYKNDYFNLFNQIDYSSNPEVLLWIKYDDDLGLSHLHQRALTIYGNGGGLTKNLVEDYLCSDGLPIAISPLYKGDNTMVDVKANRDQRLVQTVWGTGEPIQILGADTILKWIKAPFIADESGLTCVGGYQQKKGAQPDKGLFLTSEDTRSEVGYVIYRFAEVLLNYAEAKAELGSISQNDIDMTINKLRDRVNMPHLIIDNIAEDPNWLYPDLSPLINEIRRERRVEFALENSQENFRINDIMRWGVADKMNGRRPRGIKFDVDLYNEMKVGVDIYLDENGYIDPHQKSLPAGYNFNPNRDYLSPIPTIELNLNSNLIQNPGWD